MKLPELEKKVETLFKEYNIDKPQIVPEIVTSEEMRDRLKLNVDKVVVDSMARRVVKSHYRTWLPTSTQAFRFERKGLIDRGILNRSFADAGVEGEVDTAPRPDWADRVYRDMFAEPTLSWLQRITRHAEFERKWLETKLKHNLIHDDDLSHVYGALTDQSVETYRDDYIDQALINLRAGLLLATQFDAATTTAMLGMYQAELVRARLTLEDKRFRVDLRKNIERERVRHDLITYEQYVSRIINVGVDVEIANAEAELIAAEKGVIWEPAEE